MLITPHGWKLVSLETKASSDTSYEITISDDIIVDLNNISNGTYSPLNWFLKKDDFENVVENMRLANGTIWSIPIVLDINQDEKNDLDTWAVQYVLLKDTQWNGVAILKNEEIYSYDKDSFASNVFGTTDTAHPWVQRVYDMKDYLIGGELFLLDGYKFPQNGELSYTPSEVRNMFEEKWWETVVAFQTRNPPHRSHEYLQKCALENCDGLLIHPVVGKKKTWDFMDKYILGAYKILTDKYYKKDTTLLSTLPIVMRYAWPREAVLHSIMRKNYGCSHIIVGRDHAGVGDYYGTYDAQNIFKNFTHEEMGINVLGYEHAGYCTICEEVTSNKTCPHGYEDKVLISGTKLRAKIKAKEPVPNEFIRKEVLDFLVSGDDQFVQ